MHIVHLYKDGGLGAVIGVFFDMEHGGSQENAFLKSVSAARDSKDSEEPSEIDMSGLL